MIRWHRIVRPFTLLGPKPPQDGKRFSPRLGPLRARSVNRRGTHLPERKERTLMALEDYGKRLRLEAQQSTLLGTVFEMDKWLDNPDNRADQLRWRRLLRERDEVVEQLRFNRRLLEAHKEANQQR